MGSRAMGFEIQIVPGKCEGRFFPYLRSMGADPEVGAGHANGDLSVHRQRGEIELENFDESNAFFDADLEPATEGTRRTEWRVSR